MAESRISTIWAFLGPWYVKVAAAVPVVLGTYDVCCNQFGWPKVPELWGMTGSLLPWWGWLLILQAVFVYAMFEYVRRIQLPGSYDDGPLREKIAALTTAVDDTLAEKIGSVFERIGTVDRDLRNMMDALSDKIDNVALMALQNGTDHAEAMKAVAERIDAAEAAAKGARAYAEGVGVSIRDVVEGQAEALREQREFQAKMETWVGNLQRKIRYGLVSADNAFAAILDRENMQKLLVQIEAVREELSGPTDRLEPMGDRNAWLAKYGGWYRNVEAWARLGEKYRPGTLKRVFAIIDSDYEGDWKATDDLFPDSKAVHKYKTFRIYSRNFFVELEAVERCVTQAAFVHPSQRPQPVLDEEDDDDQPYIPPPPPKV